MKNRQSRLLALVLATSIATVFAATKKPIEWKEGIVLEGSHRSDVIPGSSSERVSDTRIDTTDFAIKGKDLVYSVEETKKSGGISGGLLRQTIGNRLAQSPKSGCKLVVKDSVMYAEDGNFLLVMDLDERVCKLAIIGRERVKREPKPNETIPAN